MKPEEVVKPENLQNAQQYVDFVKNNLQPLADHLKVSVEWLWQILVQQARVEAIVYLIVCLSLTATTIGLSIIFFKHMKKATFKRGYSNHTKIYTHKTTGEQIESLTDDWDNRSKYTLTVEPNETNNSGFIAYITGPLLILMIITSLVTTTSSLKIIVTGLVNPEFRAIEKIVEYAKPAANNVQSK